VPEFTYIGDPGRTYLPPGKPALTPEPGKAYQLAADPGDGRWQPVKKPKPPRQARHKKPAHTAPAPAGETKE
jgi:hypothetical protein